MFFFLCNHYQLQISYFQTFIRTFIELNDVRSGREKNHFMSVNELKLLIRV